jgi:protein TonB
MLISKFDLYKAEWLDLVFEDRNKNYGAYELRQSYGGNMVKAMGITFFGVGLLCAATIIFKPAASTQRIIVVDNTPKIITIKPPVEAVKKIEPPAPVKPLKAQTPAPIIQTTRDVPPVVVVDAKAEKPVINDKITGAVGQTNTLGKPGTSSDMPEVSQGTGSTPDPGNTVFSPSGIDVMPEPVGGINAWSKFLNKNLRFPPAAQEEGISGRVILSFIIEKDGTLTNITVDRPAGHGFDEEALRVLKLAKAWKPGMQNGQPVRVKYSIPINFQLSE